MIEQKVLFSPEECHKIKTENLVIYPPIEDKEWWASHSVNDKFKNKQEYEISNIDSRKFILSKVKELGVNSLPYYKVIHYTQGGYFNPHIDAGWNNPIRRKTMLIQLSSENEYQGGNMYVKDTLFTKQLGNVILFDSNITHELKVVESGDRFVMVCWLGAGNLDIKKDFI